ncbi:MAG TPA: acyl-CoA dehydrogenase family protein [Mycobacteriales bacterium]|jgi:alkylation response protein AidB-like acyl-CoA dehydrogenase|nr:acyl-CoA dehydrogenase family protein [Mycobacteriales bacterium]
MRWHIEDTPERAAFREQFRGWLREVLPAGWLEAVDGDDDAALAQVRTQWDLGSWQKTIGGSGYGAPLWPKEFGGLSGEPWMQQIVREELTRYRLPSVSINILGVGLAGPTLIEHGSEAQKERYLPKILTAEEIWCQLFSEPGSGSDLASLATRAVRDGDNWVVNGQKVWTTLAHVSRFGMLLARTDPEAPKHDGLTYFIVDMQSPGVEVRPLTQLTGSAEFNEVFFTDVVIPDANRVGAVGEGWRCARTTLMNERVALSGIALDRVAFMGGTRKDPWGSFLETVPHRESPLVRDRLAQLYIDNQVKEVTAFRAAAARAAGRPPGPEGSIGKVFNAELNQRRSEAAVDAAGMAGVAWMPGDQLAESRAQAYLRARANTIEGGTSEVLRSQIAERLLGLPREPEADKGQPWSQIRR